MSPLNLWFDSHQQYDLMERKEEQVIIITLCVKFNSHQLCEFIHFYVIYLSLY